MPGVPSGRGCHACRRQKKKCDQQRPACGRCARLAIACEGAGARRYKFQTVVVGDAPRSSVQSDMQLSRPPVNARTAVVGRLVAALAVDDPRFDLSVYGAFVRDVPRRIGSHAAGSNAALDAAAWALAELLPLAMRGPGPSAPVAVATPPQLRAYGHALQALRLGLGDPAEIGSMNTLVAMYLVVVLQGWLRDVTTTATEQPSHGEALVAILQQRRQFLRRSKACDESPDERDILSTLCFLLILESFDNPRIQLDADLWHVPEPPGPRTADDQLLGLDSLSNRRLAGVVTLIREEEEDDGDDHRRHRRQRRRRKQLWQAYNGLRADRATLDALLATVPVVPAAAAAAATGDGTDTTALTTPLPTPLRRLHVRWQTAYGILTTVAIRVNLVLAGGADSNDADADDADADFSSLVLLLRLHRAAYARDLLHLATCALQYRPLGASAVPLFLRAAERAVAATAEAAVQRAHIRRLLALYRPAVLGELWL